MQSEFVLLVASEHANNLAVSGLFPGWPVQGLFPTVADPPPVVVDSASWSGSDSAQPSERATNNLASLSSESAPPSVDDTTEMGKHKKAHSTAQAAGSASHDVPASLRGRDQNSSLLQSAVKGDLPNSFPQGPDKGGEHCYAQLDGSSFQIRGPNYLEDKVKIDSCPSVFDLMHVDVFRSHEKIGNCAARHDSWLRAARRAGDTRYYFVVVYVTPADPFIHLVIYFAVQPDRARALPHFSKLWEQFTAHGPAADAFRDERWKVIPRVAEGSWIVSNAVGTKPALLAQKLTHTWIICDGSTSAGVSETPLTGAVATADAGCGATSPQARQRGGSFSTAVGPGPYLEADCDVASSSMAFVLVSLLQSYAK